MKIAELHVYQIDIRLINGPYVMSGATLDALDSTVVELVTDTGLKGYGEPAPQARPTSPSTRWAPGPRSPKWLPI